MVHEYLKSSPPTSPPTSPPSIQTPVRFFTCQNYVREGEKNGEGWGAAQGKHKQNHSWVWDCLATFLKMEEKRLLFQLYRIPVHSLPLTLASSSLCGWVSLSR